MHVDHSQDSPNFCSLRSDAFPGTFGGAVAAALRSEADRGEESQVRSPRTERSSLRPRTRARKLQVLRASSQMMMRMMMPIIILIILPPLTTSPTTTNRTVMQPNILTAPRSRSASLPVRHRAQESSLTFTCQPAALFSLSSHPFKFVPNLTHILQ